MNSGAAAWFASTLVSAVGGLADSPLLLLLAMAGAAAAVRFVMPNIAGYLAFIIPVAMSTGASLGLNPMLCGLAVVIVGDFRGVLPGGGGRPACSSTSGRESLPRRCCGLASS